MTKGEAKAKFVWVEAQQKAFKELKCHPCIASIIILLYLQQTFEIKTNTSNYVVNAILTMHEQLTTYHNKTLFDFVR